MTTLEQAAREFAALHLQRRKLRVQRRSLSCKVDPGNAKGEACWTAPPAAIRYCASCLEGKKITDQLRPICARRSAALAKLVRLAAKTITAQAPANDPRQLCLFP